MNAKTRCAILSSVWIGLAALALVAIPVTRPVHAQMRIELIPFESMTLTDAQVLMGEIQGKSVAIAGELRLPRGGTDKLPAVILVPGVGGIVANVDYWARAINGWGAAVFIQDSLSGRGISGGTREDFSLWTLNRMFDAYRSLGRLAQHPRIDPSRIAVMGFSNGATGALWSSSERFVKLYGPPNVLFAAHIGLYAQCGTQYRDDDKVTGRPMRLFHGSADDDTSVEPCRAYVERLKKKGVDANLTEFAGVMHFYDNPALKETLSLPQSPSRRHCSLIEGEGGQVLNAKTGNPFTYSDPCVEKGIHFRYDEAATAGTREGVKALLVSVFGLKL